MISEEDIRKVRDATDLVSLVGEQVVLRQRNREFWGNCPFHNEKTASFKVDPAMQFYHCFGCGESGDAFKFVMKTENVEFPEAVRILAQRANIELADQRGDVVPGKKARLYEICAQTAALYHHQLMRTKNPMTDAARAYLGGRGMGGEVSRDWMLGFAPGQGELVRHLGRKGFTRAEMLEANVASLREKKNTLIDRFYNRVIFPIRDVQGRVIAFGGRVIGAGEPKYLNSSDTLLFHKRDNLFAIDRAKADITARGAAIVVEGYTDVIAMHQAGFTNTVATLGTALTAQHIRLLARFARRIILLFDGDEAGQRAATRAADLISVAVSPEAGNRADLAVAVLPGTKDPAELCADMGSQGMSEILQKAVPLLRFALDRRLAIWDLTQPETRSRALDDVVRLLVPVKGTLLAADYLSYLADVFMTDSEAIQTALNRARPLAELRTSETFDAAASTGAPAAQIHSNGKQDASDTMRSYERELLSLYIREPTVRTQLRAFFTHVEWLDDTSARLASILLEADATHASAQLLSLVAAREPQAASLLAAARLSPSREMSAERLAESLMASLREGQLQRQIRAANARLRRMPADSADYDALYEQTAALQREVSELKKRMKGRGGVADAGGGAENMGA
jgi:DNA primase